MKLLSRTYFPLNYHFHTFKTTSLLHCSVVNRCLSYRWLRGSWQMKENNPLDSVNRLKNWLAVFDWFFVRVALWILLKQSTSVWVVNDAPWGRRWPHSCITIPQAEPKAINNLDFLFHRKVTSEQLGCSRTVSWSSFLSWKPTRQWPRYRPRRRPTSVTWTGRRSENIFDLSGFTHGSERLVTHARREYMKEVVRLGP